jgi:CheY-like chemotaxis protein
MGDIESKHILIIDDEPQILKLLSRVLSKVSKNIDTANNGREGIEKIDSYDYNLILTDIKMPDISGEEVCHYLKVTNKKQTPIIGMSGTPWLLDHTIFNAVLEKPCSKDELLETVDKLLDSEIYS